MLCLYRSKMMSVKMDTSCYRIQTIVATLLLTVVFFVSQNEAETVSATKHNKRPNIVFIMADDLGFNDVSYHNRKGTYTPTIDKLAREGVRLENYYVQPICAPTRSQFMSGRSQIHTGLQHRNIMRAQPNGLPLDSATLPDKLKEAGYATDMVGKWHLGFYHKDFLPTNRGFDTFYGLYLGGGDHYSYRACKGGYCALDLHNDTTSRRRIDFKQTGVYSTHLFTQEAKRIIKHRAQEDKPFFLFLSYTAVHSPIMVPRHHMLVIKRRLRRRRQRLSRKREKFVAMTYALDCGVRKIVSALKQNGVWDNTVLVFSTDNGGVQLFGGSNLPLKGQKRTYFEGGVRGVAFASSPLFKKTGYINREMMHVTDWFPTFMHLANESLEGTRDVNGFNQWETLSNGSPSPREEILYNIDPLMPERSSTFYKHKSFDTRMLAALRKGDYKIITGFHNPPGIHLYNVVKDPRETTNLMRNQTYHALADEMLDRLQEHQQTAVPVYNPGNDPNFRLGSSWQPWRKYKLPRIPTTNLRKSRHEHKWIPKEY